MRKLKDDDYQFLTDDVDRIRTKTRMYLSFSGSAAAKAVCLEGIWNSLDEAKNPRSPCDKIDIEYDERIDTITISDNGRGIPTEILEKIFTTLNSGSNIDSGAKADLKVSTLGRNGVGTLALNSLAERFEVVSFRGSSEGIFKRLVFSEGIKIASEEKPCHPDKHGLTITYKPSKILGKNTKIIWNDIHVELVNTQFLNKQKIKMTSTYVDKDGIVSTETYKTQPFESILLLRNDKETIISDKIKITISDDNVIEEIGGKKVKKFMSMDIVFTYTNNDINPYIDSFCNLNNTIDSGSHLDGAIEGLCRFFQQATKETLTERDKLDVKWDDVKSGLSIVVSLESNQEELFTSQTKHKVFNEDLEKLIKDKTVEALKIYFKTNQNQLRDLIAIVKMNAKARREADRTKNTVLRETMTNWSSFKMKNYDPCTNKGKEYKELFIIEGDSAKGSLKLSRDPKFQALFAIRGVSANVFKINLEEILANKEFNDLIKVMGCNVGPKFDLNKLQYNKIVIASDADVDALFIRSLLCSFFFKVFPEIIQDGRLYIAEPPLYKVDDKKNQFVVNKEDYIDRYVKDVAKEYRVGCYDKEDDLTSIEYLPKNDLYRFLFDTSSYVDDIQLLSQHYKINDRLMEMILVLLSHTGCVPSEEVINGPFIIEIQNVFPEMYYDTKDKIIKGVIDGKYQSIEISERLIRKGYLITTIVSNYPSLSKNICLKHTKTGTEHQLSMLETLKVLKKFQPSIEYRFKGLGENSPEDLELTTMNPNTRSLIRVHISDIENDMSVFQALRGDTKEDLLSRKALMAEFKITREMIDT